MNVKHLHLEAKMVIGSNVKFWPFKPIGATGSRFNCIESHQHLVFILKDLFKKISQIDSSTKGLHSVFRNKVILERYYSLALMEKEISNVLECRSHFKNLFNRRKFFWLTLPQNKFILYMKMECIIIHYSYPSSEGISYISKWVL